MTIMASSCSSDILLGAAWTTTSLIAIVLTSTILVLGTRCWPLSQLGNRPMGRGLLEWLWNCRQAGIVWGYDDILGAWSPPCRLAIHVVFMSGVWSFMWYLVLGLFHSNNNDDDDCGSVISTLLAMIVFAFIYMTLFYVLHHKMRGVSYPGGPRDHKIQRIPTWPNQSLPFPTVGNKTWNCVVAKDSHNITEKQFSIQQQQLTGEPAGRQIWTTFTQEQKKEKNLFQQLFDNKDEEETLIIRQMASGGRTNNKLSFNPSININTADRVFREAQIRKYVMNQPQQDNKSALLALHQVPKTPAEAAKKGTHFYSMLQTDDGHWAGDYGGPHFLMPGLIVAWYIMGQPEDMLNADQRVLMQHYITVHQQTDGGWGTHIESPSTMFGTTLMYVALRLLGVSSNDRICQKGRAFLQQQGGATMTSSWAKFYLCLLGCMEWEGHNSVPAEMWLLPNWFPFHPGRLWCHCRMVYLPMGYLYGSRFVYPKAESDPVIASLRKELYREPYESIHWIKTRNMVAPMDNYSPIPLVMEFLQNCLARYETCPIFQPFKTFVRSYGLKFCLEYMTAEDLQTNYIDIGPVNKVLNMISAYHAAGNIVTDPKVIKHMMRVPDYLWVAEDGMKMQGYNGSQCWDTSFAIQAMYEAGLLDEFPDVSAKVWKYLERTQILSTKTSQSSPAYLFESNAKREKYYRHVSQGGWPFSTSAHGWPISDCTGEGLKGVLCLMDSKAVASGVKTGALQPISEQRLHDAINVILTLQNEDGGWATYENNRGFGWYEQLNPSEVFGDIMIDYSYVECSMASLTALADFHEKYPLHRQEEISQSIQKGKDFLKSIQRDDGSWYGSWACCFCYGCWFGIEGLVKAGEPKSCEAIRKCCDFLLKHQRDNGGWGEDFTSCYDKDYAAKGMDAYGDDGSGVVNTAWALLALSAAECQDTKAIRRGVRYLMKRQLPCGDWPQEGISGVFNRACGITYTAYRNVFPIWALGRCVATYGDELLEE